MFRVGRGSVLAALDWETIDGNGLAAIEALVVELVGSIAPASPNVGGA